MNKLILAGIAILYSFQSMAGVLPFPSDPERDTVILNFGNNSQIIIYVDNKEDLEYLTQYDINKVLEDLNLQVNNLNDSVQVLEIKDETGERYLKDTVVVYQVEPSSQTSQEEKKNTPHRPRPYFNFILDVGLDTYLENGKFPAGNQLYALRPLGSWYWNLGPMYKVYVFGPLYFDMGLSAALNIYRFDNSATRLIVDDSGVNFALDVSPVNHLKSKLATWHLQGKAIPMLSFGKNNRRNWRLWNNINDGFRIGAGPYVGYRIWARTKYTYNEDGDKKKDKYVSNHLLSNIRYGIRGQIGVKDFDFFIEYDLNEMFQEGQGAPPLNRIQFGVTF
ncbi:MAG: hypothetical protein ABFS32_00925 [Bacteroidota bacterium]